MPAIKLNNISLSYERYGDKKLPAVILIMGLGLPAAAWPKELVRGLIRKGLQVITVDNRDSGYSSKIESNTNFQSAAIAIGRAILRMPVQAPYKLEDMALDIYELMKKLDIPSAHIVGASLGGMVAQVLAYIKPSCVKSLTIIMSASGNPRTGTGKLRAIYTLFMQPEDVDSIDGRQKHYEKIFHGLKSPEYEYTNEQVHELLHELAKFEFDPKASERQLLAILASGDRSVQLARISAPSLIIHGKDDPLLPLSAGKELAELIPNSKFIVLEKMGHDLPPIHTDTMVSLIASHVWENEN